MLKPPIPHDEEQRLRALRSLNILDSASEERFDRITRVARRLFGVPIALVSLVDTNRQWFKSRQGLDVTETPRDVSFCGHTIQHAEPMVVPDTLSDERFADNPLVTSDPGIRFYAGCPVRAPGGEAIGTLCIIDREPRKLSESETQSLSDLAGMVEDEIGTLALATTDSLTGISNRRGFEMLGDHALRAAARNRDSVALVYIDLDGFKEINDDHGHAAGDAALIEMASLLVQVFRDSDVVARLGGDEFAVLMSVVPETEVHRPLDRLAERVAARNESADSPFAIHYSAGVVTNSMRGKVTVGKLLEQADGFMYSQKKARRLTQTG